MAPLRRTWAELPTDILASVMDRLHTLQNYLAIRGVCTAWRSALPPEPPCLVVQHSPSTASSSSGPFRLMALPERSRCIGACHGWVAIVYTKPGCMYRTSYEIISSRAPHSCNGTRNERTDADQQPTDNDHHQEEEKTSYWYRNFDGAQVPMDRSETKDFRKAGTPKSFMALFNPVTGRRIDLPEHDRLDPCQVDKVVFAPNPRTDDFTVVAAFGFNSLAYVSTRDVDGGGGGACCWSFGNIHCETVVTDMVYREENAGGDKVYCLLRSGDVQVLHVPRGGRPTTRPIITPLLLELAGQYSVDPAYVFPPPHDRLSGILEGSKSLAFCGGEMYQVWRNTVGVTFYVVLPGPGDGWFLPVRKDEVFVLRYDASRRPCWTVATDLGGHAVFVGPRNSAASVRADEVPGVKGDCVYWIGRFGNRRANVFDMRTRRSAPCVSPSSDGVGVPVCWYSLGGRC